MNETIAPSRSRVGTDRALLLSALDLAARGWRVFPCRPGGKAPALRGDWQKLATEDHRRIRAWWERAPYNIGVACGLSGLVVLDLDLQRGQLVGRPDPAATGGLELAALCDGHGQPYPVPTYAVRTPSGGCHLYYLRRDTRVRNSAGRLAPLVDVRGDGGYVIGAGSGTDDGRYTVIDRRSPVPFPAWIAEIARRRAAPVPADRAAPLPGGTGGTAYAVAALRAEAHTVAAARPGSRNDTLNRAAFSLGQLSAAGLLPPLAAVTALSDAAARAGLPQAEVRRTIRSGMAAGARKPRF